MAVIYWQSKGKLPEGDMEIEPGAEITMGRAKDNKLFLLDPHLSRHHSRIFHEDDKYFVEDLNSRNGTCVNGSLVVQHELAPGDEIQLGETVISFDKPFVDEDKEAPYLLMLEGMDEGKTFSLKGDEFTVGRKPVNDLVLDDYRVSGQHVKLLKTENNTWTIVDLESKNGTFINGDKIQSEELEHGSSLSFGGVKLRFLLPALPIPPLQQKPKSIAARKVPELSPQKQLVFNILMVIALCVIFVVGYQVANRMFSNRGGVVPEKNNKIGKYFSFEHGESSPEGWIGKSGVVFTKSSGGLPPGRFAGKLRKKNPDDGLPGIVKFHKPVSVVSGKIYELSGYCSVKGKGASCLVIKWIDESGHELIDYGEVCRSGKNTVMSSVFCCPPRTQNAQICLNVFGGAEAIFDQVEFIEVVQTGETESAKPPTIKKVLQNGDFSLSVKRNGPFDLLLQKTLVLGETRLWIAGQVPGLPGEALGFGSLQRESSTQKTVTGQSMLTGRNIFLPGPCEWIPLQKEFELNAEGGRVTWKLPADKITGDMRLAFVFMLPEDLLGDRKRFSFYSPLGKEEVSLKELVGKKLQELVIGGLPRTRGSTRPGRIVLSFPGVGTVLRQGDEFIVYIEKEISAETQQNIMSIALNWSHTSTYEVSHINEVISNAEKLASEGREGRAVFILKKLLTEYKPDKEKQLKIKKLNASYIGGGQDFLKQVSEMNSEFLKTSDPAIRSAILLLLDEVKSRFEGCVEVISEADKYILQLTQREKVSTTSQSSARLEESFNQVRKLFTTRRYAAAYLLSRRILETSNDLDETMKQSFTDIFTRIKLRLTNKAYLPPLKTKEL